MVGSPKQSPNYWDCFGSKKIKTNDFIAEILMTDLHFFFFFCIFGKGTPPPPSPPHLNLLPPPPLIAEKNTLLDFCINFCKNLSTRIQHDASCDEMLLILN